MWNLDERVDLHMGLELCISQTFAGHWRVHCSRLYSLADPEVRNVVTD